MALLRQTVLNCKKNDNTQETLSSVFPPSTCTNTHTCCHWPEALPPVQASWWKGQSHDIAFGSLMLSCPEHMNQIWVHFFFFYKINTFVCSLVDGAPRMLTCVLTLICLCRRSLVMLTVVMASPQNINQGLGWRFKGSELRWHLLCISREQAVKRSWKH